MLRERLRFLVVDDDPTSARAFERMLRRMGDVTTARSADEAQAYLQKTPECAAVVLDIVMPGRSGLEVLRDTRDRHPGVQVLLVSGHTTPEFLNYAFDLGADYLPKPVEGSRLRAFIERKVLCVAHQSRTAARSALPVELESVARAFASRHDLTEAQTDVLWRGVRGEARWAIADARRASEATVNRQISDILQRTGYLSFHQLVEEILRLALRTTAPS